MSRTFRAKIILAAFSWTTLLGCYSNIPIEGPQSLKNESKVALYLNSEGTQLLAETVGDGVDYLEGTVLEARGDTLSVSVSRTAHPREGIRRWSGEPVTIPPTAVRQLFFRELDRRRTTLVTVAGIAAVIYIVTGFASGGFGFDGPPDTDPPPVEGIRKP